MTPNASAETLLKRPGWSDKYREEFVRGVYRLLAEGFRRLHGSRLSSEEEPAITGFLRDRIDDYLADAPRWAKEYFVEDEVHLRSNNRKGKNRLRVDLEIEWSKTSPRSRFQFEAKCLRKGSKSVSAYLGSDGLGCFLSESYAKGHKQAGMLGYIQSGQPAEWAEKIRDKLTLDPQRYRLGRGHEAFKHEIIEPELPDSYQSIHTRKSGPIEIHHIFLVCHR